MGRKTNLETLRGQRTRDEIARAARCSAEQIRKLEAGFKNPGLELARRLAAVFGAHVDDVFPPARGGRA